MAAKTEKPSTVTEPAAPVATPETTKLTNEQLKALGAAFMREQKATEEAEAVYEAARLRKSGAVKAICEALGHKGPFSIGGKLWSATERKSTGFFSMSEQSGAKDTL